ncbi:DNAJ heat shock N-terminal domain-containing protein [Heterostelium album PN500]|uniref:DNAJ heat shock N-terminal domain-containing protein n=1 Tax=Heterostelium pallidum (strain ATCC 26659 / Pp 5 / PN500) TaxID=670386 RepID=D3B3C2_HETP5|nr:DNAJ heat shock N-terminal domain-containing protein [Heterostelium album PN500]EFA83820.1 DNAJ heat shock N-terminal domain-containing protein [Heterostelium album PN500]|eukprot:XP_020435937.1 DNAJ heat shock N-terminal domain-containing protein [Heterostelium album PN500]
MNDQFDSDDENELNKKKFGDAHDDEDDNFDEDGDPTENIDYYAVLNVPRDASASDIQNAYRKLAMTYHPDKHQSEELRQLSQHKFAMIKRAKEVLSDEKERAIYDNYGVAGLENAQSIIKSTTSVESLLAKFARANEAMKEERLLNFFNGHGYQAMSVAIVPEYNSCFIKKISTTQSFKINSSKLGTLEVSPTVIKRRYDSNFECRATHKKVMFNRVQMITSLHYSETLPILSSIGFKGIIGHNIRAHIASTQAITYLKPLDISGSLSKSLSPTTEARISAHASPIAGQIGFSISRNIENRILGCDVMVASHSGVTASISRQLPISKKTVLGVSISTNNQHFGGVTASISRRISPVLQFSFSLAMDTKKYVYSIGVHHKYQSFEIPIPIYTDVHWLTSVLFFTVPSVIGAVIKLLVIDPLSRRSDQARLAARKEKHAEAIGESRRRAAIDVQLMKPTVDKKIANEKSKNGLIIQEAVYGVLNGSTPDQQIDVTIALQYIVEDSKLELYPNKKSDMLGFYDPCIGEHKQLRVSYFFQGKLHQVTVNDEDLLRMPLKSHLVK